MDREAFATKGPHGRSGDGVDLPVLSTESKWLLEDMGMTVADIGRSLKVTPAAVFCGAR